ncbi:FAD-dependent oxidoreductase [Amycolatopsis sp. NPDC047767]|uniref:NAD(P)/FAD-dependent oxidoreductase n=1 Tax=Amycolatopsis sp. NPDC047767 TaxID=3156765 RepID=UPI003453AED2
MTRAARRHVAVVGASLAGVRTAEALRAEGFDGRITLIGAERHPPYDRPPLSKQVLSGEWAPEQTRLDVDGLAAELLLGRSAIGLDLAKRTLRLDDGDTLAYDAAVIATGTTPRVPWRLPPGAHPLRTLDDALAVRAALSTATTVAVIGGGFIGTEVAAAVRGRGLPVTLLMPEPHPLALLGPRVAGIVADVHRDHGVTLRTGVRVQGIRGRDHVEGVVLADGETVPADLVVLGTGVAPATGWLAGSGVPVRDGVLVDGSLSADPGRTVFAVGDVARFPDPRTGRLRRVEHWTNAVEQARHAARALVRDDRTPYTALPYFWSDQYDRKLHCLGTPDPADHVRVSFGRGTFTATYDQGGTLTGALACNAPRELARLRAVMLKSAPMPR